MMPALTTNESQSLPLVLVIDKIGVIGDALAKEFCKDYLVVFASANKPSSENKNIIHIPFRKRIPEVPDNSYSKIFILDDGESVTRQSAFSFISKARAENALLFFIGSIRNIDIEHADEFAKAYANSKVLAIGDLFDKKIFFDKEAVISRYILTARKNLKIDVSGNGLGLSFPISFEDTIKLIIKASYVTTSQKVILLFYPHPITDISLANVFQKVNPDIKVDFIKKKKDKKIFIPQGGMHAITKYNLEGRIKELELEDIENREVKVVEKNKRSKSFFKPVILLLLIVGFLISLPVLTTAIYSVLATRELNASRAYAEKGDFNQALKKAKNSKTFFETSQKTSNALLLEARIIRREKDVLLLIEKIESGKTISSGTVYVLEGSSIFSKIYSGGSNNLSGDFSKGLNSLKTGIVLLQKVRAEGNLPKEFEESMKALDPFLDLFSNSSDVLMSVLGFEGEKNYLVLFQNDIEIRPGGGLIGSVGILKIKDGKVTSFFVQDVNELDTKLKAHVEPPFAIRRYLPSQNFYLKDSNFDPDFVNSAISASNMYSLITGEKVDGVIGVDLFFAKNILNSLGEITIDQNTKVNAETIYERSAKDSAKKSFLSKVFKSIEKNLGERKSIPYLLLAENVGNSIKEKHLVFAFQDESTQSIFTANGWSSSLWDNRILSDNSINDYFGIVESNMGKNNINHFISRSVSKKLMILDDGAVSSKLTIGFKNNSEESLANYKNYVRLVLPEGSRITSFAMDGKEIEIKPAVVDPRIYELKSFRPPAGLEVEETQDMNKSIFGFLVSVAPKQVKSITISYSLPFFVSSSEKSIDYSLKIYKQPGIESYPFDLTFSIPFTYKLSQGTKSFTQEIRNDENLTFNIVQN